MPKAFEGRLLEWLSCGTAAVFRAVQALGLGRDDVVLMPDYNCGVELAAVLHAGAQVEYYRTQAGVAVDMEDLAIKARSPAVRVIYVIHYFGFAQPINEIVALAQERQQIVIEDCAHSLYSEEAGVPLGERGDYAIFSPRKFLPLADGGVLTYKAGTSRCRLALRVPDRLHTLRETIWSVGEHFSRQDNRAFRLVGGVMRKAAGILIADDAPIKPLSQCGSEDFISMCARIDREMSSWSLNLIRTINHAQVIHRRRANFSYLLDHFPRSKVLHPLREDLPPGMCPLFFPVLCTNRDDVYRDMRSYGIETFRYWRWKHPSIPPINGSMADMLRHNLLAVPLHQALDEEDLRAIVDRCKSIST